MLAKKNGSGWAIQTLGRMFGMKKITQGVAYYCSIPTAIH